MKIFKLEDYSMDQARPLVAAFIFITLASIIILGIIFSIKENNPEPDPSIGAKNIARIESFGNLSIVAKSAIVLDVKNNKIIFNKNPPEYLLLLIWNIKDIIIPKLVSKGYKGKFIVPVPEPHIISYGL